MEFAPTILNKLFDSNDEALEKAQEMIHESEVISEHGSLIPHTILMKHEDYPDDDVMVDSEGRKWVLQDNVARFVRERNEANQAAAEMRAGLERQIADLQRGFRDTFLTLAFTVTSKEGFSDWYDRNSAVIDAIIAAKRKGAA